jgi:hypothetical protein
VILLIGVASDDAAQLCVARRPGQTGEGGKIRWVGIAARAAFVPTTPRAPPSSLLQSGFVQRVPPAMDTSRISSFVSGLWDAEIVPQLVEYIRIPNKSPMFDAQWREHGYMDKAVALMESWTRSKLGAFDGASLEVVRLEGRTPLIYIDVPAQGVQGKGTD